ncbi:MAG TPA: hypothetical protein VGD42_07915 [Lysobacter sp.]
MIALLIPFLALAVLGLACSLVVHVMALAGVVPPGGDAVYVLHMGVFVVWIPTALVATRLNQGRRGFASWRQMLAGCPVWMRYAAVVLFVYSLISFFLAMRGMSASQGPVQEPSPQTLRAFSGHWMLFYGLGFCVLFAAFRNPWMLRTAKCASGHKVMYTDRFCPTCGTALPERPV